MSQRLIDAEHLRMSIYRKFKESGEPFFPKCRQEDVRLVDSEPTIDPVKHGHWIDVKGEDIYGEHYQFYKCSKCQSSSKTLFRYCPQCGAKMDEVVE